MSLYDWFDLTIMSIYGHMISCKRQECGQRVFFQTILKFLSYGL